MKASKLFAKRPSPAMVVACAGIILALGGSAVALQGRNSVRSDDIAPRAVKSTDIAPGAVTAAKIKALTIDPFRTRFVQSSGTANEATTTSNQPVDLQGPSVTVNVPRGGLVAIWAAVDMRVTGGGQNQAQVHLSEASLTPSTQTILETGSASFVQRLTAPGVIDATVPLGVGSETRSGWLVFPASQGRHTYSLTYSRGTGGTAIFRNRQLFVTVLR